MSYSSNPRNDNIIDLASQAKPGRTGLVEHLFDPHAQDFRRILQERRSKRRLALSVAAGMPSAVGAGLTYFSPWSEPDFGHLERHCTRTGEHPRALTTKNTSR